MAMRPPLRGVEDRGRWGDVREAATWHEIIKAIEVGAHEPTGLLHQFEARRRQSASLSIASQL